MLLQVLCVLLLGFAAASSLDTEVLRYGQELDQLLDKTKSPCQDFYGYVCGRSFNYNQTLRRQQEQQRFQQLLRASKSEQLLESEQQLLNFYKSCDSSRDVKALKGSPLYRSSGGWPVLQSNASQPNNWLSVLAEFHAIGAFYFFETKISIQSNQRVVVLQPDTTRRHTMRKFEQRVGEVLQRFGVEQSRAHVAALEVLSLERSRRDIVKTEWIDDQVQYNYANFSVRADWNAYFKKLMNGKTLRPTDKIIVKQMPRLMDYIQLLQNTSTQRLLNWLWTDYLMDIALSDCQQLVETFASDLYAHVLPRVSSDRVQLTQLYASIGQAYKQQLTSSVWIDEISAQASQHFLSQLMHATLNGDENLNAAYQPLQLGRRSFYRNLEKLRSFQHKRQSTPAAATQSLQQRQYSQAFEAINGLLPMLQLGQSAPLNYMLLSERFARSLLSAGSSSRTPGAWRSMDSERQFAALQNCSSSNSTLNTNELLLGMLSQRLAWSCYKTWLSQHLPRLVAGRPQLTPQRHYFVGNLLLECRDAVGAVQQERKRQLTHAILRNTPEFSEAFSCRSGDALYAQQQRCKLG
ncbi:CG9780, partial [Drosophila busckii]